jgi:hypothetical protein
MSSIEWERDLHVEVEPGALPTIPKMARLGQIRTKNRAVQFGSGYVAASEIEGAAVPDANAFRASTACVRITREDARSPKPIAPPPGYTMHSV